VNGWSAAAATPDAYSAAAGPKPIPDDPFAAYRTVGTALAFAVMFAVAAEFLWNALTPTSRDFISFWGAAQMALAGNPAGAYDLEALHALQSSVAAFDDGKMPFPYPPAFLLVLLPFGLLSFPVGLALWSSATFAVYLGIVRHACPGAGWLPAAFAPIFATAAIGQNGFATAAIFIGGLLMLGTRPFAAGLLLGCLAVKPQLGLLLPVALIAARQWRAIAGATIAPIGVLAVGLAVFGTAATQAWIAQMPLYGAIARDGMVGWGKLASVYAALRQLGTPLEVALALHVALAAAAAFVVWRVWRSDADAIAKAAVLAAATMLISPYLFLYDGVILTLPFLWLAASGERPMVLAPLWLLPFVSVAQIGTASATPNLLPLVPLGLTTLLWMRLRKKGSGESQAIAAPTVRSPAEVSAPNSR
jgi:hypothetical protein